MRIIKPLFSLILRDKMKKKGKVGGCGLPPEWRIPKVFYKLLHANDL